MLGKIDEMVSLISSGTPLANVVVADIIGSFIFCGRANDNRWVGSNEDSCRLATDIIHDASIQETQGYALYKIAPTDKRIPDVVDLNMRKVLRISR